MTGASCIFCGGSTANSSASHILPASLGGDDWALLPNGLVCSRCNQYFGSKVESYALQSFPFLPFRVFLGIPTRKRLPPKLETHLGALRGSTIPGYVGLDPSTATVEAAVTEDRINRISILAEPTEPVAVCRMLVKMGVEVIAADSPNDARNSALDSARTFARYPARGARWWFFLNVDHARLFERFRNGISPAEWAEDVSLGVCNFDEFQVFRLQLLDMVICTPLDGRVLPPDATEFSEPDFRLFQVRVGAN